VVWLELREQQREIIKEAQSLFSKTHPEAEISVEIVPFQAEKTFS